MNENVARLLTVVIVFAMSGFLGNAGISTAGLILGLYLAFYSESYNDWLKENFEEV